ncbi:MAG: aldo/keto reductase [Gemmatimonadota bacterium]
MIDRAEARTVPERCGLFQRAVLGTAQLGLAYGSRAGSEILPETKAEAVLEAAWELGIRAFDTAEAYGPAAERLAGWLGRNGRLARAEVVTKVEADVTGSLPGLVEIAVGRFTGTRQVTVLSHGAVGESEWAVLVEACESLACEVGQSVYTAAEATAATALPGVRRLQLPANAFDLEVLRAGSAGGVPLDVRSVFLQGLLLVDPITAEERVAGSGILSHAVRRAARAASGNPASLLIATIFGELGSYDRIVIGAEDPEQVHMWRGAASCTPEQIRRFRATLASETWTVSDRRILDPRAWEEPAW